MTDTAIVLSSALGAVSFIQGQQSDIYWQVKGWEKTVPTKKVINMFRHVDDAIEIGSLSEDEAIERLDLEYKKKRGLIYFLSLFDEDATTEENQVLQNTLNRFLEKESVYHYIESVMCSSYLPDVSEEYLKSKVSKEGLSGNLFFFLVENKNKIAEICSSWDTVTSTNDNEFADEVKGAIVELGVFRALLIEKNQNINILYLESLKKLEEVPESRVLLKEFFKRYLQAPAFPSSSQSQHDSKTNRILDDYSYSKLDYKPDIGEIISEVNSKISECRSLISNGKYEASASLALSFSDTQVRRGDSEHAAKTLCNVASMLLTENQCKLGIALAEKACEYSPGDSVCLDKLANAYYNDENFGAAEDRYDQLTSSDLEKGLLGLLRTNYRVRNYDKAVRCGIELVGVNPKLPLAWMLTANSYRKLKQYDEAILTVRKGFEHDCYEPSLMCTLAATYVDLKRFEEAETQYRECMEVFPKHSVASTALGHLLAQLGKFMEAFNLLIEGIVLASKHGNEEDISTATNAFLSACSMECRYAKRLSQLPAELMDLKNREAFIYAAIEEKIKRGIYNEAHEQMQLAEEKYGRSIPLQIFEAKLSEIFGNYDKCHNICDQVIKTSPTCEDAWLIKLALLRKQNRREEYRASLQRLDTNMLLYPDVVQEILLSGERDFFPEGIDLEIGESWQQARTAEDWGYFHALGVYKIKNGDSTKQLKGMLVRGKKHSPTTELRKKYKLALAIAKDFIGQTASMANAVRGHGGYIGYLVRAISYWKQGLLQKLSECISFLKSCEADALILSVIRITNEKYREEIHLQQVDEIEQHLLQRAA